MPLRPLPARPSTSTTCNLSIQGHSKKRVAAGSGVSTPGDALCGGLGIKAEGRCSNTSPRPPTQGTNRSPDLRCSLSTTPGPAVGPGACAAASLGQAGSPPLAVARPWPAGSPPPRPPFTQTGATTPQGAMLSTAHTARDQPAGRPAPQLPHSGRSGRRDNPAVQYRAPTCPERPASPALICTARGGPRAVNPVPT